MEFLNKYNLTEEDLVGGIRGFPLQIVEVMLDKQRAVTNKIDISEFQRNKASGFRWSETPEGVSFWWDVIGNRNFKKFFIEFE